ncbi:MAG TPA: aspartate--tRNA ligase, partial [Acidimicrobiia bacterium]|nr:aspartate--tRNA ligase [Acidimicrobiia bacterium]
RNARAGLLRATDAGIEVRLAGWVATRRDHGGVMFVDLRDASGLVQVVVNPEEDPAAGAVADTLRDEFCITVAGTVRLRPDGTVNPDLPTGAVEVAVTELRVLSPSEPLPFQIDDRADVDEAKRLEFRYLDLRRPRMAANLVARSRAVGAMRTTLFDQGFLEVETPTLVKSTPEGARDVLVPSRLRPGSFYALPQSPQLFKQLLMVGGVERYYQVARCYRDEDFRADRQIEFTQLDIEGSFWGRDDVFAALEPVIVAVAKALRDVDIPAPFARLTWGESMARFGTDKPDLRFGMELVELSGVFAETGFKAFADVLGGGGLVAGIDAGRRQMSRSALDALVDRARDLGAKGLVWMVVEGDGTLRSPVAKFLSETEQKALIGALGGSPGDLLLIVADRPRLTRTVLGALRLDLGRPAGHDQLEFLWVTDFPVFAVGDDGSLAPEHHPFTAPYSVDEMRDNPTEALSRAYDLVLNGVELGSGSERIHDPRVQKQVFDVLGISDHEAESRFGWFMRALRYGTPPHAGFAVGVDRLVMILQNEPNIREVMPFPKTQSGYDPMTESPGPVDEVQLRELGIDLRPEVREAMGEEPTGR